MQLKNNVVLVTGASDGIGFEVVKIFLEKNYTVVAHYHSGPGRLDEISPENLLKVQADFSVKNNVVDFIVGCTQKFNVNILINNAAYYKYNADIDEINLNETEKYINVNLVAPYILSHYCSKNMIRNRKGKIINISSVSTKHGGSINSLFYTITKSALEQLTKSLSKEYSKYGINILALRVGVTNTKFHQKNSSKSLIARTQLIPLNRFAEADEIANIVYLFCTQSFSFCTGTVVDLTGGE